MKDFAASAHPGRRPASSHLGSAGVVVLQYPNRISLASVSKPMAGAREILPLLVVMLLRVAVVLVLLLLLVVAVVMVRVSE